MRSGPSTCRRTRAAALLFDEGGIGTLNAIEANAIDPEQRARFRLSGETVEALRGLGGGEGAFIAGTALPAAAGAPIALRTGRPYVLPLRDARRLVGFAVFASSRRRRLTAERRTELARVGDQVGTTAVRIRGGQAIEAQRSALAGLLEAHSAERSEMQVATWLARSARDIAIAHDVAVLQDLPDGGSRVLYAIGRTAAEVERGCVALVDEVRRRGVAVVITDGTRERRIHIPSFLRVGATALIPVRGQGLYLFAHEPQREGLTSGILQLLVELCDQAATLLASAYTPPASIAPGPAVERRLAAVVAHTRGASIGGERESRARIVDAFRLAVEGNQPVLAGSGERVAGIAIAIASALAVEPAARDDIYVAALLRDVGELGIDRRLLEIPGELTDDQREVVRRHPALGETDPRRTRVPRRRVAARARAPRTVGRERLSGSALGAGDPAGRSHPQRRRRLRRHDQRAPVSRRPPSGGSPWAPHRGARTGLRPGRRRCVRGAEHFGRPVDERRTERDLTRD